MKTIRLIVSIRLAVFPIVLNLTFALEVEVVPEELLGTSNNFPLFKEGEPLAVGDLKNPHPDESGSSFIKEQSESDTQLDSQQILQNDRDTQENETFLDSSADASEGQTGGEEQNILDSSTSSQNDGEGTQDSPLNEPHPTPLLLGEGNHEVVGEVDTQKSMLQSERQENLDLPNLKITEVYRLGSTEWIEITNLSQSEFYGTLTFSGANNYGNILYADVEIQGYESIILASIDDIGMINGNINSFYPKKISITDGKAISIELQYSGNTIDTFDVEESYVSKNQKKTPRPSFQKIYNDGREIQITTEVDSYNISGFVANPGKIIVQSGNPREGDGPTYSDNPGEGDEAGIGDNPGESSDFNLIISEVYYDGKDEWIEIFNIGDGAFYGDIEIAGEIYYSSRVSQIYTDIQIPAKDFLIIANSDEMFDFESGVNIILNEGNYKKFSIGDTKEIQISLIIGGEDVDSFYAHEYRVKKRDNWEVSFHKVLTENGFVVTWAGFSEPEDRQNISSLTEVMATPGVLISTDEKVEDYSKDPTAEVEPEPETEIVNCEDVYQSPVTVSEIFWGGSRYNPFIEFDIHDDLEWYDFEYLEVAGSLVKTPIYIDLLEEDDMYYDIEDLEKNTKLILTTKPGDLTEAGLITIVLHPDLGFNSEAGELELYGIDGQSRQVLDIVKIGSKISEKSVYRPNSIHACGEEMDNVMDFSPGFDESALKYFSVTSKFNEKVVETVKYVGGGGGCSCPSIAELCGNAVETGNEGGTGDIQDSSLNAQNDNTQPLDSSAEASEGRTGSQEILSPQQAEQASDSSFQKGAQIKIVSLEPKSPESITLQSFLPYDIDFKNHSYYLKTSTATTKKYIEGILYANTIDTFSKNFGFVDAGACVYLYSGDNQLDSYCYSSQKPQDEKEKQETENFNPSDYQLSITHIDYDPEGSDSGNETITIQSNSSKSLDLSKIKMKVNSTNKKLTGILEPYSSITLKGNFGFPNSTKDNSDVVVILFYDNHIFSTFTYNPNKPKVEIPQGAVKVYSVIDGDTFRYRKEDGSLQSVRLLGVDAPESNTARYRSTECFGKEAKNYLTNLIKNQYVTLEFDSNSSQSDAYGRALAYVYLDGKLVNETLIAEGYAKEYTYKTSYTHQSSFKQAEEKAKRSEKGLWSSSICGKSIAEEPEAWGVDYEKLPIKISDIVYDPDGTDSGNEIVQLNVDNSQISVVGSIDFSDDFSLTIFPRSEYSTGTTKTKKLSEFGLFDLSESSEITLKGNFGLPNNRATCVSLNQGSYTFDTRCYNSNGIISEEELVLSGQVSPSLPDVKIQSITPNPSGTDAGKEEISLLRTPSQDFPESLDLLDLSSDFSLLVNGKTKKKLVGNLTPNQKITIKGSFGLPNSASCVSLLYHGEELDNFCYSKASDGVKFNSNNISVREISAEELAIVKKITLVKKGDKLCISYNKTIFSCKSIPNSTTEKNAKLLSMQNSYISELENYIKSSYSMIYYDSQLKDYFNLYSAAKKAIKAGSGDFTRGKKNISLTDVSLLFQSEYEQGAKDYFVQKIQSVMPESISLALLQAEDEYTESIVEKSDLSFLSFAE